MSIRKERLQLIRERHRELVLSNRQRVSFEAFDDDWDDSVDYVEDDLVTEFVCEDESED